MWTIGPLAKAKKHCEQIVTLIHRFSSYSSFLFPSSMQ